MTTYGMEIEVVHMSQELTDMLIDATGVEIRQGDDGSIRQISYSVESIPVAPVVTSSKVFAPQGGTRNTPIGLELITPPLEKDAMYDFADKAQYILRRLRPGLNASIHIHMDIGNKPWGFIKNLVHWFYNLEAVMYRLSGLGMTHRGVDNDFKFCRPLSAPIHARSDLVSSSPLIDMSKFLNASSASRMFEAWGRMDMNWGESRHYSPHRLHGINIYSVPTIGTVELRVFNGVYSNISLVVDIATSLYELAERANASDFDTRRGILGTKLTNIDFELLRDFLFVNVRNLDKLQKLWYLSRWLDTPRRGVFHHYSDNSDNIVRWGKELYPIYSINSSISDIGSASFVPYVR